MDRINKFTGKKLTDAFHSVIGRCEQIFEAIVHPSAKQTELCIDNIDFILQRMEQFKAALEQHQMAEKYEAAPGALELLNYTLRQIRAYVCRPNEAHPNQKDAYIFAEFLEEELRRWSRWAFDLDEKAEIHHGQHIRELFNAQKVEQVWAFSEFKPSQTGKWTHDYHRYPAKFVPQLVEKLIDEYITNGRAHVNDPFMGSGTTIVTAMSRGLKASGTDINRIAHLITKVKSKPIEPTYLEKKIKAFLSSISFLDSPRSSLFHNTIMPKIPEKHIEKIDYWFPEDHKVELGTILAVISDEEDETFRDFLLVAFSNILKNCSIWSKGSTKPTRDLKKTPICPYPAIRRQLSKMQRGNDEFYYVVPCPDKCDEYLNVEINSAKKQPVPDNTVDLIVSSSPYVTSYEYADLHQLSTIWLDLAENLTEYRSEFIGTSHRQHGERINGGIGEIIVDQMAAKSRKKAREIAAFFSDMQEVFDESFRILKPGGRCCYVIGNTKLKGVDILNAEVFAESLPYAGLKLDRIIKREIPLKILPQKRDEKTGRFASRDRADSEAYPTEYIVVGLKE